MATSTAVKVLQRVGWLNGDPLAALEAEMGF
jgi:hypothetical protein